MGMSSPPGRARRVDSTQSADATPQRLNPRLRFESEDVEVEELRTPGMTADLVVFDPDAVQPITEDVVHDFPNNGWRMRELAEGIHCRGERRGPEGYTGSYPLRR